MEKIPQFKCLIGICNSHSLTHSPLHSTIEVTNTAIIPIKHTPYLVVFALSSKIQCFFYQLPRTDAKTSGLYYQVWTSKTTQIVRFSLLAFTHDEEFLERFLSV